MTADLRWELWVESKEEFLTWALEEKIRGNQEHVSKKICHTKFRNLEEGKIEQVEGNQFTQRTGEAVHFFSCQEKKAEILTKTKCFNAVPISEGYVRPGDRLLLSYGHQVPCNIHFPLTIR